MLEFRRTYMTVHFFFLLLCLFYQIAHTAWQNLPVLNAVILLPVIIQLPQIIISVMYITAEMR